LTIDNELDKDNTDSVMMTIGTNHRSATGAGRRKRAIYHEVQEWTTGVDSQAEEVRSSITR
jgi:hypothetical protein